MNGQAGAAGSPACPASSAHGPMALRKGNRGAFWSCGRWPSCRATIDAATGRIRLPPAAPDRVQVDVAQAAAALAALRARLDGHQRAVAAWTPQDPHLRILAAAGSGKTTTLTALVASLIEGALVPPARLIVTTFSRAAADVLVARLSRVIPADVLDLIGVGTWHALALRHLRKRQPWRWRADRNLDGAEVGLFLRGDQVVTVGGRDGDAGGDGEGGVGEAGGNDSNGSGARSDAAHSTPGWRLTALALWSRILSNRAIPALHRDGLGIDLDGQGLSVKQYQQQAGLLRSRGLWPGARGLDRGQLPRFADAWALFEQAKKALRAWDYADALAALRHELRQAQDGVEAEEVAPPDAAWPLRPFDPRRGRVVVVDEAQDNDRVQLDLARRIAGPHGRVVLVGDPAQAVHAWRGAAPEVFLDAEARLGAVSRPLLHNYRSGTAIIELGNRISVGKPWCGREAAVAARRGADGQPPAGLVRARQWGQNPQEAAQRIAAEIAARVAAGEAASRFAVLARTNGEAGLYELALLQRAVPTAVLGRSPIFEVPLARDFVAYLLLADGAATPALAAAALKRVANRPLRYLSAATLRPVYEGLAAGQPLAAILDERAQHGHEAQRRAIVRLRDDLANLRRARWPHAARFAAALLAPRGPQRGPTDGADDQELLLSALTALAEAFPSALALAQFARRDREAVVELPDGAQAVAGRATVSTVHKAKGREWPVVYVAMTAGMFPHPLAGRDGRQADEERLAYVAWTRAMDELQIGWAAHRWLKAGKDGLAMAGPSPLARRYVDGVEHASARSAVEGQQEGSEGFAQDAPSAQRRAVLASAPGRA